MKTESEVIQRLRAMEAAFHAGRLKLPNHGKKVDYSDLPNDVTVYCGDDKYLKKD